MNKKQFISATVFCVILIIICIFVLRTKEDEWQSTKSTSKQELLKDFDVNLVSKFTVSRNSKEATLSKQKGTWKVVNRNNYPADFKKISESLLTISKLKISQQVKVGPSQFGRLQLSPSGSSNETGTILKFFAEDKSELTSMMLGKVHISQPNDENPNPFFGGPSPDGRYVMLLDGNHNVVLVAKPLKEIVPDPSQWLDKDFYIVNDIKSISLTKHKDPQASWKLYRTKASESFKLEGIDKQKEELVGGKISRISSSFNYFKFEDVAAPAGKPDQFALNTADMLVVKTFSGFSYSFKISHFKNKYYIKGDVISTFAETRVPGKDEKPEDKEKLDKQFTNKLKNFKAKLKKESFFNNWVYIIAKSSVEPLTFTREQLVQKKKKDEKKTPVSQKVSK